MRWFLVLGLIASCGKLQTYVCCDNFVCGVEE